MIELLLASELSCASSQELLNRVNEYAKKNSIFRTYIQEVIDVIKEDNPSVLMKDQNTIEDTETKQEKWNRGLDIFIESVIKPDPSLRQCAHNQRCYHELMDVREDVLYLKSKRWN